MISCLMANRDHFYRGVLLAIALAASSSAMAYDCIELKCTQMTTCAEAQYKFEVCHHSKRDADNDGIPCEDLCGKDLATYRARAEAQTLKGDAAVMAVRPSASTSIISPAQAATSELDEQTNQFSCSGKRTCKQMLSCDEAKFYLKTCGVKSLDGDQDGVPCNSLCRNR
jgi:Excalibur calcium-binding domain